MLRVGFQLFRLFCNQAQRVFQSWKTERAAEAVAMCQCNVSKSNKRESRSPRKTFERNQVLRINRLIFIPPKW